MNTSVKIVILVVAVLGLIAVVVTSISRPPEGPLVHSAADVIRALDGGGRLADMRQVSLDGQKYWELKVYVYTGEGAATIREQTFRLPQDEYDKPELKDAIKAQSSRSAPK